ncbi:MAG: hypothetical protein M0P10_08970, partial [Sphaerochaetaceae bacterium]|nr:hypothetical protein [Sphaerochaetaceae bacterium]
MPYINKLERAKLMRRDELLPFNDGQILSTKLSSNDALSIELYSIAKGESISSHNLMNQTLYVVLTGTLEISGTEVGDRCYLLVEKDTPSELIANENTIVLIYTFAESVELKNLSKNISESFLDKIDLVKEAVSSKILLQRREISLTLFSFDTGEGLSTHKAGGDAMVIPLEGEVNVMIGDDSYTVEEGD